MWNRALWNREFSQARLFLWAVPTIYFLIVEMQRLNEWIMSKPSNSTMNALKESRDTATAFIYQHGNFEVAGRSLLVFLLFVLALVQLGTERRNGSQELLFSLPYSRTQIYVTKWLLGVALVTGTLLLNGVIDIIIIASSPAGPYMDLTYHCIEFSYSWLVLVAMYSLFLFIGSITGSVASQTILSVATSFLPMALARLIGTSLRIQGIDWSRRDYDVIYPNALERLASETLNLSAYLSPMYENISWREACAMLILLVLMFTFGLLSYVRNRTENNGKLMIFPSWETVLRVGFVLCASMVAGLIGSGILPVGQRIGYDIGLLLGLILSWLIIRKLTQIRLKI